VRARSSVFRATWRGIDHRPWACGPHASSLVVVSEGIPRLLSAVNLFVVPVVEFPLNRPAPPSLFWDSANAYFAVASSAVRSGIGILQTQFLLLVVAASLVGFMSHTSVPRFIRVQCSKATPVTSPAGAEGRRLVSTASCALVAESVEFISKPALDSGGSRCGYVVGSGIVTGTVEWVEIGWWKS
jgi:hypothetical protein